MALQPFAGFGTELVDLMLVVVRVHVHGSSRLTRSYSRAVLDHGHKGSELEMVHHIAMWTTLVDRRTFDG